MLAWGYFTTFVSKCPTGGRKYECVMQIKDRDEIQTVAVYAEEENHLE